MKSYCSVMLAVAGFLVATAKLALGVAQPDQFIYETPAEFVGTGDFDGDGRKDIVIVDKASGKYRLGYQLTTGAFTWVDCRPSGVKSLAGFSIGKLLATNLDALAFSAPDENQITIVEAANPTATSKSLIIPFSAALGPSTVLAIDIGGPGNTPLSDLYVGSIYNSPDANQGTLLRNDGAEFPKLGEETLPGAAVRANRIKLKAGQPELFCALLTSDKADALRIESLTEGKPVTLAAENGLPSGSEYTLGRFRGQDSLDFLVYKPGEKNMTVLPMEGSAPGSFRFGKATSIDLGQVIRRVIVLEDSAPQKLFVIFGQGEEGGVFNFDGLKAPALLQTIKTTNELLSSAIGLPEGLVALSRPANTNFSTRYYLYKSTGAGAYSFSAFGTLASLLDNDNVTIPEIHDRIVANLKVREESEMKPYTNTIPGTTVSYAMVPIPGGEFTMGSQGNEAARKSDEGPQHKVRISPFWMGRCEVTWNEYELFMFHDEEVRMRSTVPTDETGDKLADAVTHPTTPYVEMSFGMGKDNFPAIAMTQHGASKYCQWLSAKTGEFYRLPTEAEWEYACRAGTTTAYFFGNDPSQLPQYAWFEQNSDFKYQKVGKKKPNPWGLYDIYGNVVEWVLDQYDPDFYKQCAGPDAVSEPWNKATKPYPHSVRGGSWDDEASRCRSAARRGSDKSWKMTDPQLPKSKWYFTDSQIVGFRIVRPLKVPPQEQMQKYWNSGVERE